MKTYYKIVNQHMMSVCAEAQDPKIDKLAIKYKVGEWVYPEIKESHLFVFGNIDDARYFLSSYRAYSNMSIYEAEIKDIKKNPRFVNPILANWDCLQQICRLIKNKKKRSELFQVYRMPQGTIAVGAVKLIQLVG